MEAIRAMGLGALYDSLVRGGKETEGSLSPGTFRKASLVSKARHEEALDMLGTLGDSLSKLTSLPALLLKGCASAYSLYAIPSLRPIGDIDVLVPPGIAIDLRKDLAFKGWKSYRGAADAAEFTAYTSRSQMFRLSLDVHNAFSHWQGISNRLSYETLFAEASHFSPLPANVYVPALIHQVMITSTHYVTDDFMALQPLRLMDIYFLLKALSDVELARLVKLAADVGLVSIVASCAFRSAHLLEDVDLQMRLKPYAHCLGDKHDPSSILTRLPSRLLNELLFDFVRLDFKGRLSILISSKTWLQLYRQLIPEKALILKKNPDFIGKVPNCIGLPFLYGRRIFRAILETCGPLIDKRPH